LTISDAPLRILVVCTGNICRSPAAAALLRARSGGLGIEVASVGTAAVVGHPMHPLTAAALAQVGVQDPNHRARQLSPADVAGAHLVLTAERRHRVAVFEADPTALRRTFTIAEFARLAQAVEHAAAAGTPADWIEAVASIRGAKRPSTPSLDDLADPILGELADHQGMVAWCGQLVKKIITAALASVA
jgi:protein-tyrosine phosphatase